MAGIAVRIAHSSTLHQYQRVQSKARKGQRTTFSLFLLILTFICSLIFFVWSRLQITYVGYHISRVNNEQQQLLKRNQQLKLEIASLKSLSRIEHIAKNQLGLITPSPDQVVFIQ